MIRGKFDLLFKVFDKFSASEALLSAVHPAAPLQISELRVTFILNLVSPRDVRGATVVI